jgi:uncharacterized membrane protein YkoI
MKLALATGCLLTAICARTATPEVANGTDYEKLFAAATFSLTEAIDKAVALPEAKECVVVNAEIEEEGGKIIYSIQLAKGQKILEVNFDVTNGAMQPVDVENEDKSAQAKAAKITVKQALETATKKKGTKAIEASLVMEGDKPIWQVNVWTAKKAEKLIRLDAITGDVVKAKKDAEGSAGDKMAPYRTLADDAIKAFKSGDLANAKKKAEELEKAWDTTGKKDLSKKPELWKEIDTAMDAYIDPLMKEASPDAAKVEAAYKEFIAKLNKGNAP